MSLCVYVRIVPVIPHGVLLFETQPPRAPLVRQYSAKSIVECKPYQGRGCGAEPITSWGPFRYSFFYSGLQVLAYRLRLRVIACEPALAK